MKIGIAGAGLLGRLAAWTLARQGHEVHVFDPACGPEPTFDGQGAAGFTAAGMLSPTAELDNAEPEVAALGWQSIAHWAQVCSALSQDPHLEAPLLTRQGSLLLAHGPDLGAARRVLARIEVHGLPPEGTPEALGAAALQALEPGLHSAQGPLHAWWLPGEAHIDTPRTLAALHAQATGVQWHWGQAVAQVEAYRLLLAGSSQPTELNVDWALDLRGVGARPACAVRGVRGELVWLHAPGLRLQRPVRLLHPRYRVYVVPRPGDVLLVGASEIESEDRGEVTLRSAVELMAAAHSVLPDLGEARILRLDRNLRPAMPDHRPMCHVEPGLIRINGLYRHGWLLAPALLAQAWARARLGDPLAAAH